MILYCLIAVPDNKNSLSYLILHTSSMVFCYLKTIMTVNDQLLIKFVNECNYDQLLIKFC